MKRVIALLILALCLVIAFAVLTGGGGDETPSPQPPVNNTTQYRGTVGVLLPNNSTIGAQVRNGIDTAYLLQDQKTRPNIVYLNGTETSLPSLTAVITATDAVSTAWDTTFGSANIVHVAVASPGYAANAPNGVITFSPPPHYEIESLRSLIHQHEAIGVIGPDSSYTAAYADALASGTSSRVVSETFSSLSGETASLRAVLAKNPGLLIITGGEDIPALVARARELGLTGPVMVPSWIGEDAAIANDTRMEGVYTAKRISDMSAHPFYTVYHTRFGTPASVYAAEGYDAMMTLSRLVPQSNGVAQYVSGWYMGKNYEGSTGSYEFDTGGTGRVLMQIAQFRSGVVIPVDTYLRPPSEVIIGVYGNAEIVRGATAAAEMINNAYNLPLPGAATSGISGLYGAKLRILPLAAGTPVPENVTAVVGDLRGVDTDLPGVWTTSRGGSPSSGWIVSLSPDVDAGFSSLLAILDERRGYGTPLANVTILSPVTLPPSACMLSMLDNRSYQVDQVSYPLPLTEEIAFSIFSGTNISSGVIISIPESAEDLTLLLTAAHRNNAVPAVWYVAGEVILGDPKLVQNTLVYEYLTGSDIWSSELGKSKPLVRDVSLFYAKVLPGQTMTGVSARSFEAVVILADAMSVSGSTNSGAIGSALKNLNYSAGESIFAGTGISFDGSGMVVGPKTMTVQIQSGTAGVVNGAADLGLATDRVF